MPKSINKKIISAFVLLVILFPVLMARAQDTGGGIGTIIERDNVVRDAAVRGNPNPGTFTGAASEGLSVNTIGSGIMSILAKAISFITVWIAYAFGYLAGLVFTFAGLFLSFGLKLNGSLLQSPTVNIGWSITRDLANLGFVLGIIFIAIATILRSNKYGMKKILWRLITVAILINFSLTFAGILIDASGLMTNFFMAKVVPPAGGTSFSNLNSQSMAFSSVLANAFGIQKALDTKSLDAKKIQSASEFGATTFTLIANMFFVVLFTIMGATVMLATAALVFVRYVVLMILLILMPLAWLGWIFEGSAFHEAFQQWWKAFIEWLIWLPAAMFFIYLTILIVVNQSQDANSVTQIAKSIQTAPQGNVLDQFLGFTGPPTTGLVGISGGSQGSGGSFETFGQMLAVLGLMSGGLIMANRISNKWAKIVLGFAGQAQGYLLGKVKGAAQKTAGYGTGYYASQYAGHRAMQEFLRGGIKQTGVDEKGNPIMSMPRGQRIATTLSRIGLRETASNLSGYLSKGKDAVSEVAKRNYENLNDDALIAASTLGGLEYQAARGIVLAKRDKLDKISKSDFDNTISAIKKMGADKEVLNNRPDLAVEFGKKIEDVVKKISDISAVSKKAFENSEVLLALNNNQLKKIHGSQKVTEDTIDSIKKQLVQSYKDVVKEIKDNTGKIPAEEIIKLQKKREDLEKKVVLTHLSPSWSTKEIKIPVTYTDEIPKSQTQQIPKDTAALRQKLEWRVNQQTKDLAAMKAAGEQRPTVLKSAEDNLKRARRDLDKLNG